MAEPLTKLMWFFFWGGEIHPAALRRNSWVWAQGSLLAGLRVAYGVLGIEPELAMCKIITFPDVLSFWP